MGIILIDAVFMTNEKVNVCDKGKGEDETICQPGDSSGIKRHCFKQGGRAGLTQRRSVSVYKYAVTHTHHSHT